MITMIDKPTQRTLLPILAASLLAPATAWAAAPEPDRSAERIATETCVWNAVRAKLEADAPVDDIDARLAIGRDATDQCAPHIRKWAEASPAVNVHGEALADVELRMAIHYTARGALFAEGKAEPFYLAKPEATKTLDPKLVKRSTPRVAQSAPQPVRTVETTEKIGSIEVPDEIAPAVGPYITCRIMASGTPLIVEGKPVNYNLPGQTDCAKVRENAAREADKLLIGQGMSDKAKRRAFVDKALADADSFTTTLSTPQSFAVAPDAPLAPDAAPAAKEEP